MPRATAAGTRRLKVLLAGADDPQLRQVRDLLRGLGHRLVEVGSGAAARAQFARHRPDLVIFDLALDLAGDASHPAVTALRALDTVRWVPIWCLAREVDDARRSAAILAGADACFNKPVNVQVFKARLVQIAQYVTRQAQLANRQAELQAYFETVEEEVRSARAIMDKLLRMQSDHAGVFESWIAPAVKFSGDVVVAERSPDGSLKILVADGVGHGLSAALNVLPVGRAFKAMAQKGFGLAALVTELNHTIRRDLPSHRFVAATLVNVDAAQGLIEVWNGGNPACVMLDRAGGIVETWASTHLPLGVVDSGELDPEPERRPLRPDGQLVLFTDGAIEAIDDRGLAFGEPALLRVLCGAAPEARLDAVRVAVVEHLAGRPANDDVTLALLDCAAEMHYSATQRPAQAGYMPPTAAAGAWDLSLELASERLKGLDMVPVLQEFLGRIDPLWARSEASFSVLADLYTGALEQGLLQLDARLNEGPDGFNLYAREREARLQDLAAGPVRISIRHRAGEADTRLLINIGAASPGAPAVDGASCGCAADAPAPAPGGMPLML